MNRNIPFWTLSVALLGSALSHPALADNTVTAIKLENPPELSAGASDPAWKDAKALAVNLVGGANFDNGQTRASIKAAYGADRIYILVQYRDQTFSQRRFPYQKQSDGSWKELRDPNNKGGDENIYYEDKLALLWNIGASTKSFGELGCMSSCHAREAGKPYGNKYTSSEGELGDIWHAKSIRTGPVGQVDDQYLDHTRFDKDQAPAAGRKSDPKTGGGYISIKLVDGQPEFMSSSAIASNHTGGVYYVIEGDQRPFDKGRFSAGDELASILISPFTGDRGDISAAMSWSQDTWTISMTRKLVTGSPYDVQFDRLDEVYEFGLAAFDNAQVRHAFNIGPLKLKFEE